jgi:type IV secretion system protein VirD4
LISSSVFISVNEWWNNPYFNGFIFHGALTGWYDYAFDPITWKLPPSRGSVLSTAIRSGGRSLSLPFWTATSGLIGLSVTAVLLRSVWGIKKKKLFGDAKWQSFSGAVRAGIKFNFKPDCDSILLGVYYLFGFIKLYAGLPKEGHVSLTATTGAGKGVSFVVPNCLNWRGPLVCFSIKRDVLDTVAAERERMGDRVFVFDATDPKGKTHRWSGFGDIRIDNPSKLKLLDASKSVDDDGQELWEVEKLEDIHYNIDLYDDIQRCMFYLIPETRANNPYWDNAARMVATAIGVMIAETPGMTLSIGEILNTIERHDYEQYLRDMIYKAEQRGMPYQQGAVYTVLSWLNNKAEEAAAAVRQNVITAFALWHSPRIDAVTSHSDFNLATIRSQHVSIFICAQPSDIRRLRTIYTLLFSQLIQSNTRVAWKGDPTHRDAQTLLMLDERWALGKMQEVDDAAAFVREYGFRMCTVLQTKKQLRASIGNEEADNVFNNSKVELIYGGTDAETAKEVSERVGTYTDEEHSISKPRLDFFGMKQNKNQHLRERRLMLPQEISGLSPDTVIALMKGKPPLKLNRIFWYKDEAFCARDGVPPPVPTLKVTVRRERISAE